MRPRDNGILEVDRRQGKVLLHQVLRNWRLCFFGSLLRGCGERERSDERISRCFFPLLGRLRAGRIERPMLDENHHTHDTNMPITRSYARTDGMD